MPEQQIKTKYRKWHKKAGQGKGIAQRGTKISFGMYGLKLLTAGRLRARQIEAARVSIKRQMKNQGKLWVRISPNKPITTKGAEMPMGKGKGSVDHYVKAIKPGVILFEIDGVKESIAKEAIRKAGYKLPFKCKFVKKIN